MPGLLQPRRRTTLALLWCAAALPAVPQEGTWAEALEARRAYERLVQAGSYREALPHACRQLELSGTLKGEDSAEYVRGLGLLGRLYVRLGGYGQAEPLLVRAVEITRRTRADDGYSLLVPLKDLAALYTELGEYGKAESLYQETFQFDPLRFPRPSADRADVLVGFATLLCFLGQPGRAEPMYVEAFDIHRNVWGLGHPQVGAIAAQLAALYETTGRTAQAEALLELALRIHRALGHEQHPDLAAALDQRAGLYAAAGEPANAEPLLRQAIDLRRSRLGAQHPAVASGLNHLGWVVRALGDLGQAEQLFGEALATATAAYGEGHPRLTEYLVGLAELKAATGRTQAALSLMQKARALQERQIATVLGFSAEATQLAFLRQVDADLEVFLSLVWRLLPTDSEALAAGASAVLRAKGLTLDALGRQREAAALGVDPAAQGALEDLNRVHGQLARAAFAGPEPAASGSYLHHVARLTAEKADIEARLSRLSAALAQQHTVQQADLPAVVAALPPGSALVEFAHARLVNFGATHPQPRWEPARYLAFVVGAARTPALVDLGDAAAVDQAVREFRSVVGFGAAEPAPGRAAEEAIRRQAQALHRLVFAPLVPALDGVTRVFISPEGQLRLLPFAALCDESGAYLVEHWQFSYLATGRDLVRYTLPTPRGTSDTVVMGDPDFGLDRGPLSTQELALKLGTTAMPSRCSADLQKLSFGRLPGTRDEAVGLAHWLGEPALCLGAAATEAALKAVRTPRVLHIATHGFFLADQPGSGVEAIPHRGLAVTVSPAGVPRLPPGLRLENPLLRSGLALAGANYWTSAVHTAGIEDGLLTALEASGLRLYGTDLVVLSACDTGLGEVRTGEGVFGLGRAFLAAGARSLIMSLWKVPDAETVALMDGFYRRWTGGAAKDVALREAQMDMIQALRARHGAAPPLLWAAFVLLGDWR